MREDAWCRRLKDIICKSGDRTEWLKVEQEEVHNDRDHNIIVKPHSEETNDRTQFVGIVIDFHFEIVSDGVVNFLYFLDELHLLATLEKRHQQEIHRVDDS